jgi:WD40 repeat protein
LWEKIEPAAKVLSSIAIPIVIAIGGWWIQSSVTQQSINKDYVSLAISILQRPKGDVEQDLRTWAVELLASYAPVRFSPETVERLKKGSLNLSSIITTLANLSSSSIAVSPDSRSVAVGGNDGIISVADLSTGNLIRSLNGPPSPVTSIVYSADGRLLISGSSDQTIRLWDEATGRTISVLQNGAPVFGLGASPDGRKLVVRSGGNTINIFDLVSGTLINTVKLDISQR